MKLFILIAVLYVVADATSVEEAWQQYKLNHGKTYKSLLEERRRFTIFQTNLRTIEEHNVKFEKGEVTYSMAVTQFADLSLEEFKATLNFKRTNLNIAEEDLYIPTEIEVDTNINYVKEGLVTEVKAQLNCGSCWAFSAVGAIEGQVAKKSGDLTSLSTQELVSCSMTDGCAGGDMMDAFEWISSNGILSDKEYPYTSGVEGSSGHCKKTGGLKISGYKRVKQNETSILKALAAVGPLSVAIDSSGLALYGSGILENRFGCDANNLNHGVLLVGAGIENEIPYYLIKNSWGSQWGEKGYFRLRRDQNVCGIKEYVSYPVL